MWVFLLEQVESIDVRIIREKDSHSCTESKTRLGFHHESLMFKYCQLHIAHQEDIHEDLGPNDDTVDAAKEIAPTYPLVDDIDDERDDRTTFRIGIVVIA